MASLAPSIVDLSKEESLSGTIHWEVDKDSISTEDLYSPEIEVGGMQWSILVCKSADEKYLSIFFSQRGDEYKLRSVDVNAEYKLINHIDDGKTGKTKAGKKVYSKAAPIFGYSKFANFEAVADEEKGYIKDNKFTVEIKFWLSNITGYRKRRRMDFTDPNEPTHDVVLVIEGQKIYASKQHLSIHSPVFHRMFYGEFAEKNKDEIVLKDVQLEEFIELLKVIYPPYRNITDDNVDFLLKLGDRFDFETIIDQCENFLITYSELCLAAKLVLAGRNRLTDLEEDCFGRLKTTKDVRDMQTSPAFKNLSEATKVALFDKIMQFSDK